MRECVAYTTFHCQDYFPVQETPKYTPADLTIPPPPTSPELLRVGSLFSIFFSVPKAMFPNKSPH